MDRLLEKRTRLKKRVGRIKKSIIARQSRPRLVLNRTNRHLLAQIIDDAKGQTVCFASTMEEAFEMKGKNNKDAAVKLGALLAKRASEKGVKKVVLDRRGRLYHGRILAFADAARENGLEF